ncbi:cell division protein ZapE [Gordonia sp. 'Campus']|uniref:cell division protein ZapE n=1 Tax=Gordonia sp. 'Campus' TaxID=2915824 RepID=UPI001EE3CF7F|nr:cell division protein ZapE [Gordonia sp. 'Campus']
MTPAPLAIVTAISAAAIDAGIELDTQQRLLVDRLANLHFERHRTRRSSSRRGLYIYGSAGRGKTWLADAFYDATPTPRKVRIHFHSFFDELHRRAHEHRNHPQSLHLSIDDVIGDSELLYFDELHVHDAGDARLLTRLLEYVLARRITVLATSNYAPDDLMPNPIWHHLFEPGITMIKDHFDVHHLNGETDYRSSARGDAIGFAAGRWTTVLPSDRLSEDTGTVALTVRGRRFEVHSERDGCLQASFAQLCGAPVSTMEYLTWARMYPRWTITEIPTFDRADNEAQQRFINLVDVLVDEDVAVTFTSSHTLPVFCTAATASRPDAFRMISRLRLIRPSP